MLMWMPRTRVEIPTEPKWTLHLLEVARREPAGRVRADGVERDVAEVEQPAVADDDVEADGHHDEDDHDHRRARRSGKSWMTGRSVGRLS